MDSIFILAAEEGVAEVSAREETEEELSSEKLKNLQTCQLSCFQVFEAEL